MSETELPRDPGRHVKQMHLLGLHALQLLADCGVRQQRLRLHGRPLNRQPPLQTAVLVVLRVAGEVDQDNIVRFGFAAQAKEGIGNVL